MAYRAPTSPDGPIRQEDLCYCFGDDPLGEWSLDELEEDDFDACPSCGGMQLRMPPPIWMTEEEDDC